MVSPEDLHFLEQCFSADSPLISTMPLFQPRPGQLAMAQAVAQAINTSSQYLIEAGTGTGKSFAYALPALLSDAPVIISTGTKHLQDQLIEKDLPLLLPHLPRSRKVVLLKGRNNYLCKHRLDLQVAEGHFQYGPHRDTLQQIIRWSKRTEHGDLNDIASPSEHTPWWPAITSTSDNCLGKECHAINDCFVYKNRKAALEADVVVVNHHVLLANLALQRDSLGELLPKACAVIVDEAHQLVDIVPQFFSETVSSRQLLELLRDCEAEQLAVGGDMPDLMRLLQQLQGALQALRLCFGADSHKSLWSERPSPEGIDAANTALLSQLEQFAAALGVVAERSKGLSNCLDRATRLHALWRTLSCEAPAEAVAHWYETYKTTLHITKTPLQIGEQFQQALLAMSPAWVFTSATLTVGQGFAYFEQQLGLTALNTLMLESPFDYARQALWCVPAHLPEPNAPAYSEAFLAVVRQVVAASCGRAFVLFTSHRALQHAALALQDLPYPLLVQGQSPKRVLLNQFRAQSNAVLLGTQSFWEGVDVQGEALSCVIIDKLPFSVPNDPIHLCQIKALQAAGQNAFQHYHLPRAVITLKQGAGRLIRDAQDRGVLVICDVRLITRSYRSAFIKSLPPFKRSRSLADVTAFFSENGGQKTENSNFESLGDGLFQK